MATKPIAKKKKEAEGEEVMMKEVEDQEKVIVNTVEQRRRQKRISLKVCPSMQVQKCILLGNSGVGKTSLLVRHKNGGFFNNQQATLGAGFISSHIDFGDERVFLEIWDTAGQEQFRSMVPIYARYSKGLFLVYDVTDKHSFRELPLWIELAGRSVPLDDIPLVLVANKIDKEAEGLRKISEDDGRNFAINNGFHYVETSALTDKGVEDMMEYMAEQIHFRCRSRKASPKELEAPSFKLERRGSTWKCCNIL